ncbi:MAG: DUF493 domain-containing protein [Planctomycetales bacterium]|nr:DUF493 domain-containing protein [Planctomycetales bacterium]
MAIARAAEFSSFAPAQNHKDMTSRQESIDLLMATHSFPGAFTFKVIGRAENDFRVTVIAAIQELVVGCEEVSHSVRETRGGRHVAITAEPRVESPEMVLEIYARLRELPGVVMLL